MHFGRVLLGYDVAVDGTVTNVQVLSAYPVRVFTRPATRAVENWRLAPGHAGARKVEFTFQAGPTGKTGRGDTAGGLSALPRGGQPICLRHRVSPQAWSTSLP